MKQNFLTFLFIITITLLTTFFITGYCELFNYLGFEAKTRFLKSPLLAFITTPIFFLTSAAICRKFEPSISGTVPQNIDKSLEQLQKTPTNFAKIKHLLGFKTIIINSISSLIATFGGGALGREGPSMQMSSALFVSSAEKFKKFLPKINLESWVFAGSGVGFALAFGAPLAGLSYTLEKLYKFKSQNKEITTLILFTAIAIIAICCHATSPMFKTSQVDFHLLGNQIFFICLTALCCGVVAKLMVEIIFYFHARISKIKSRLWILIPLTAGLAVATISYFCGIDSFGGGIITTNRALENSGLILSYHEGIGRFLNIILTTISGCAGGLVAPAVVMGTHISSIIASFAINIMDSKILMFCGMASFLSVILKRPITATIVVLEITNQSIFALPFLLLAATISHLFTYFYNRSKC